MPHQCPSHQSILPTQGPIHEIFTKNIKNWWFWKIHFFWVRHFDFFFQKKHFLLSSLWKFITNYVLEWMGLNFCYYDVLLPKMSAGIINDHECTSYTLWTFKTLFTLLNICISWNMYTLPKGSFFQKILMHLSIVISSNMWTFYYPEFEFW